MVNFYPYNKVTGCLSVCTEGSRLPLNRSISPKQVPGWVITILGEGTTTLRREITKNRFLTHHRKIISQIRYLK